MAKRWLLNALVKVLGEFVELDENNLNLAVWAGQITLNDLKLKADNILKDFNFVIHHGLVESLEITIPWTALFVSPLKIKINGIYLDVGPSELNLSDQAKLIEKIFQEKLRKLQVIDQYLSIAQSLENNSSNAAAESSSESYVQQYTSLIVDNVEVYLSNIHIRYEDHLTIPVKVFAVGVTIESFMLSSCNDNWQIAFISSANKGNDSHINKLATLKNLAIYWEVESKKLSELSFPVWKQEMASIISKSENLGSKNLNFIFAPVEDSMILKLTHRKRPAEGTLALEVKVETNHGNISIDSQQYYQLWQLLFHLQAKQSIRDPRSLRPIDRPYNYQSSKQWWRYAYQLIKHKPRYVKLIVKLKRAEMNNSNIQTGNVSNNTKNSTTQTSTANKLSEIELFEIRSLERKLPLEVLQVFRQEAIITLIEENKHRNRNNPAVSSGNQGSSWWSWLGSGGTTQTTAANAAATTTGSKDFDSSSDDDDLYYDYDTSSDSDLDSHGHARKRKTSSKKADGKSTSEKKVAVSNTSHEEDISMQAIAEAMNKQSQLQSQQSVINSMKIEIYSSSYISIKENNIPLLKLHSSLFLSVTSTNDRKSVTCQLRGIEMTDDYFSNIIHKEIISVKNHCSSFSEGDKASIEEPTMSLSVDLINQNRLIVSASALPVEVFVNKPIIHKLLLTFAIPTNPLMKELKKLPPSHRKRISRLEVPSKDNSQKQGAPNKDGSSSIVSKSALFEKAIQAGTRLSTQVMAETVNNNNNKADSSDADSSTGNQNNMSIEISLKLHGPKLLIPEDTMNDNYGCLLLDCGYLQVDGFMNSDGFNFDVTLQAINSALPNSMQQLTQIAEKKLYLIKVMSSVYIS